MEGHGNNAQHFTSLGIWDWYEPRRIYCVTGAEYARVLPGTLSRRRVLQRAAVNLSSTAGSSSIAGLTCCPIACTETMTIHCPRLDQQRAHTVAGLAVSAHLEGIRRSLQVPPQGATRAESSHRPSHRLELTTE